MKKIFFIVAFSIFMHSSYAQFTKLLDFDGASKGSYPYGSLYSEGDFLYGLTSTGGANGLGTLFKIKHDGTGFTKLLDFEGSTNGSSPYGNVVSDGTFLYGMTTHGGANSLGTVFKIKPDGSAYTKLLDFAGTANGSNPWGSLIIHDSFLYGMTANGGANQMGVVFKMSTDGSAFEKLIDFAGLTNGRDPRGSLFFDGTYLYGMTNVGGADNLGTLFKVLPNGTGYVKLLNFDSVTNGRNPRGAVIYDGTYLYGMTSGSGTNSSTNFGTIFKIKPDGSSYTKLLTFDGAAKGRYPYGSLVAYGDALYGMTYNGGVENQGTFFKILTDGTGFTKLYDFNITSGMIPSGSLVANGTTLYGMTAGGGSTLNGVLFKYETSTLGIETTDLKNKFSIYPNPSFDKVYIKIDTDLINATASIYSLLGQKITSLTLQSNSTSVSLAKGMYLVKIEKNGRSSTQKIMVF